METKKLKAYLFNVVYDGNSVSNRVLVMYGFKWEDKETLTKYFNTLFKKDKIKIVYNRYDKYVDSKKYSEIDSSNDKYDLIYKELNKIDKLNKDILMRTFF